MRDDVVMVAIPKELRDRWLDDLVEADTDAHKYSQEHGAGGYIENCKLCMDIDTLRAAPETVSLEMQTNLIFTLHNLLQCAETPFRDLVQKRFDEWSALQLPQPVAPVQSGGVDTFTLDAMKDAWATRFGGYQYEFDVFFDILLEMHKASVAHLTTTQSAPDAWISTMGVLSHTKVHDGSIPLYRNVATQSAPGVGSDPDHPERSRFSVLFRQCVDQVGRGWPKDEEINELFTLLTSRTEGK